MDDRVDETSASKRGGSGAGAWAAAALVLGLGGLIFGLLAQMRVSSVEQRVDTLEAARAAAPVSVPVSSTTTTRAESDTTTTASPAPFSNEPDDPAAATEAVIAAFEIVYDGTRTPSARAARVEPPTDVELAIRAAEQGPSGPQFSSTTVTVHQVTFTSPTDASVQYEVFVGGTDSLGRSNGAAVRVGSSWKVSRSTVCVDLAEAGSDCEL